jgi:hypothetical protein
MSLNSKNQNLIFRLFLLGLLSLAFSACTLRARQKTEVQNKDKNEKATILVEKNMAAPELTDAGEQLVTPYTFMLADRTFSMALEKDPAQAKAQFYKAFLKRFMVLRGIFARIRPLVEKVGDVKEFNETLHNIPNSPLKQFLLDGKPDITNAATAQNFLSQYVHAVNYFREFLLSNPELNFAINLNPYLFDEHLKDEWGKTCQLIPDEEAIFRVECNPKDIATRKINSADLLVLRQIAAGEILALSFYTSYSWDGYEHLASINEWSKLDYQAQLQLVNKEPNFLSLRPDHVMGLWHKIGQDFVAAIQMVDAHQDELCPQGMMHPELDQRKGYLFSKGLCLPTDIQSQDERQKALAGIERALQGSFPYQVTKDVGTDKETEYNTILDPLAWSRRPVLDLKTLIPKNQPSCGQKTQFPDPTLGGLLPKGDAAELFSPAACE